MHAPIAVLLLVACAQPPLKDPSPLPQQTTYYVDPAGNDVTGDGTREAPFRTIGAALIPDSVERIVVAPGRYAEAELALTKPLELFGPGDGQATLEGHLLIEGHDIVVHGLDVSKGAVILASDEVSVNGAKITTTSSYADALLIERSRASLSELQLLCGLETCLATRGSTVTGSKLAMTAEPVSKRVVRATTSSVSLEQLDVVGGAIAQVQAELATRLTLTGAKLTASNGNGLVALSRSRISGKAVEVRGARDSSLLVSTAEVSLAESTFGTTTSGLTIGVQGSIVALRTPSIEGSIYGALSVGKYRTEPSNVEIEGGTISVGGHTGLLLTAGRLKLSRVEIFGAETPSDNDAIVASSEESSLELVDTTITHAGSWAIATRDSANLTIVGGRIVRPGQGGVLLDDSPGASIRIERLSIEEPVGASGIAVFGSRESTISGARITGAAEAGILAGDGARVVVSDARIEANALYGIAAFGGSIIELSSSVVRGSPWAAFASCGDGSSIVDVGSNELVGQTSLCP
ncbi:MAG: right-handed parallel beta-helix repeat-containing protein [Deltaproteobacteria bacterium]|nr:right-handed parallel beta-helix repeat-containing protein [Deltaproteobacteria bacterium]